MRSRGRRCNEANPIDRGELRARAIDFAMVEHALGDHGVGQLRPAERREPTGDVHRLFEPAEREVGTEGPCLRLEPDGLGKGFHALREFRQRARSVLHVDEQQPGVLLSRERLEARQLDPDSRTGGDLLPHTVAERGSEGRVDVAEEPEGDVEIGRGDPCDFAGGSLVAGPQAALEGVHAPNGANLQIDGDEGPDGIEHGGGV